MAKTKEEIKNLSKKNKRYTKKAKILESVSMNGGDYVETFNATLTGDKGGWYKKLTMNASENGTWSKELVGKDLVTLEYFDGNVVISLKYNKTKQKIRLPLCYLHDIVVAASLLNAFEDNRVFAKSKVRFKK